MRNTYRAGDWNVICDTCGFKVKASQTVKLWNGLRVCQADADKRNEQDFVRARHDRQRVPDPRPESTGNPLRMDLKSVRISDPLVTIDSAGDTFLDINQVTADSL